MKKLLLCLILLSSMSSYAGTSGISSPVAVIKIDWESIGEAITGKVKKARIEAEKQSLRASLSEYINNVESLHRKLEKGELTREQADRYYLILENSKKSILIGFQVYLSEKDIYEIADDILK